MLNRLPNRRRFAALATLPVVALGAAACSGATATSEGGYPDKPTIVMVTHGAASDPAWSVVKRGADQAAKDLGVKLEYQAPQTGNAVEQGRLISAAVGKKPAGMAVTVSDPMALSGPIKNATSSGIPVVALNIGLDTWKDLGALSFVGVDLKQSGAAGGSRMADAGVRHGLCVNHAPAAVVLEQMCDGFIEAVESAGGKGGRLAVEGTSAADSQRSIAAKLRQDPSIDGVFTMGALGFAPSLAAINQAGGTDKIKIGTFDTPATILKAVKDGDALFAIDQQLYLQGYLPVQILAQQARYAMHPYGHISTGPAFITDKDADRVIQLNEAGVR